MSDNIYSAIVSHDNDLMEQVSDLIARNDTIEGRAAIADCLAVIMRGRRRAIENEFQMNINESLKSKA